MNFWERILYLLQEYGTSYLKGAGTTLVIALVSTAIGCLIGFIVGIIQTIPEDKQRDSLLKKIVLKIVKIILKIYVEVFRGTPMIVQAVFIYYGAAQIFNIQMGMWQSAFLIVSINTGAYMAESVRGGIISVDPGQTEGAKAIGMTHVQTIKDTSVLSIISIVDLFFVHKSVAGALYTYFESAVIVMCMYLIMTLAASKLLRLWEKKMDGSQNYELVDVMGIGTQLGEEVKRGE